jgi:V8-like Glu-specific endopeptidase
MLRVGGITLSLAVLAACSAPRPVAHHGNPIIGGTVDTGDPAVVEMNAWTSSDGWGCTGTVIGPRHVLTAAHCVEDADSSTSISVMFGSSEATSTQVIDVVSWSHDPQYQRSQLEAGHDAAVLVLASDAPVTAVAINRTPLTSSVIGSPVHVVGFGNDDGAADTGFGTKRFIDTTVVGLTSGDLELGQSGETTCQGDSGGPALMDLGGVTSIVGITSWGYVGCTTYGSSSRVELSSAWIDSVVGGGGSGGGGGGGSGGAATGDCDANGGWETEPNGSAAQANGLCAAGKIYAVMSAPTDVDWFTWTVPPNRTYTIDLAWNAGYQMTLYKSGEGSRGAAKGQGSVLQTIDTSTSQIARSTSTGGTYYLQVTSPSGAYNTSVGYGVFVAISN